MIYFQFHGVLDDHIAHIWYNLRNIISFFAGAKKGSMRNARKYSGEQ